MSYAYYHANVKPKKKPTKKQGFVCKICGWEYEGETLPDDIVCPICKHGAADFEPIK
jgi:rubredoxin